MFDLIIPDLFRDEKCGEAFCGIKDQDAAGRRLNLTAKVLLLEEHLAIVALRRIVFDVNGSHLLRRRSADRKQQHYEGNNRAKKIFQKAVIVRIDKSIISIE